MNQNNPYARSGADNLYGVPSNNHPKQVNSTQVNSNQPQKNKEVNFVDDDEQAPWPLVRTLNVTARVALSFWIITIVFSVIFVVVLIYLPLSQQIAFNVSWGIVVVIAILAIFGFIWFVSAIVQIVKIHKYGNQFKGATAWFILSIVGLFITLGFLTFIASCMTVNRLNAEGY
ncbi:hypothetical protein [[Mycoplasma] testudinis]|uniref:hypothetical protein n=1 Tax=[Mycoplasma] testudinis TaxID=33924 RepID=UPI00048648D5|nr:hypothetical protein [[Mycoplasma] testudinis]